jgi:hypothetical protein
MKLTITIRGADGQTKVEAAGDGLVRLVYPAAYEEGDEIAVSADTEGFAVLCAEDSIPPTLGYLKSEYRLVVPFGEKRTSYSPKSFCGNMHLLYARSAADWEIGQYRNLAFNPLDSHDNTGFFPHAQANVETRGESRFAAQNAIDGNTASGGHGSWPYESWGINRRDDAEIKIDFGLKVSINKLTFTLRADFPHDNWWKRARIVFSDDTELTPIFQKSGLPQEFPIPPKTTEWLIMRDMQKDEADLSPFPALVQLAAFGTPAVVF